MDTNTTHTYKTQIQVASVHEWTQTQHTPTRPELRLPVCMCGHKHDAHLQDLNTGYQCSVHVWTQTQCTPTRPEYRLPVCGHKETKKRRRNMHRTAYMIDLVHVAHNIS